MTTQTPSLYLRIIRTLMDNHGFQSVPSIANHMHGGIHREIERACDQMTDEGWVIRGKVLSMRPGATNKVRAYKISKAYRKQLKRVLEESEGVGG